MNDGTPQRVAEMLPAADESVRLAAQSELRAWIDLHANVVRSMGPTNRTTAHVAACGPAASGNVECSFVSRRGDRHTVFVTLGEPLRLEGQAAGAPDAVIALSAIGGLLESLGMLASLR